MSDQYKFFNHAACEFYPCHDMPAEQLNCLFCFCPLYCLGDSCGGNFTYIGDVKDCSFCTVPHRRENYDYLMQQFERVKAVAARSGTNMGDVPGVGAAPAARVASATEEAGEDSSPHA